MKSNKEKIWASLILGICLIVASLIYAYSTRYELAKNGFIRVDKWTGSFEYVDEKD